VYSPVGNAPPYFALGFKDAEVAKAIFTEWRTQLGEVDRDEQLRISIVTGIDIAHPHSYAVVVGVNLKTKPGNLPDNILTVSRVHRMDPPNPRNFDGFLSNYKRAGSYILMPAHFTLAPEPPKCFPELAIQKWELHVCPAWQLGENDPEILALRADDNPIIPDHIKEPPVIRAMQRIAWRKPGRDADD
jgi:hypothetical protein